MSPELVALTLCLFGIPAALATTLGLTVFKHSSPYPTAVLSCLGGLVAWFSFLATVGQPDLFQAASALRELSWPIAQLLTGTSAAACLGIQVKRAPRFGAGVACLLGGTVLGCHLISQALQSNLSF